MVGMLKTAGSNLITDWCLTTMQNSGMDKRDSYRVVFFMYAAMGLVKLLGSLVLSKDVEVLPTISKRGGKTHKTTSIPTKNHARTPSSSTQIPPPLCADTELLHHRDHHSQNPTASSPPPPSASRESSPSPSSSSLSAPTSRRSPGCHTFPARVRRPRLRPRHRHLRGGRHVVGAQPRVVAAGARHRPGAGHGGLPQRQLVVAADGRGAWQRVRSAGVFMLRIMTRELDNAPRQAFISAGVRGGEDVGDGGGEHCKDFGIVLGIVSDGGVCERGPVLLGVCGGGGVEVGV
ncbi:hypothetical protein B0T18DRAFT_420300 [Schizothecium vesticola]|uniref:Uncharacterized protein n=1 Tax=Schizothecium vesticola TaxID=314040 RepID=A0AA40K0N7_9PEZI|nr:hypothetical protein B0T18DRAFT_420300 [Schizothecium vesticola]